MTHAIYTHGSTEDLDADWKRIRIACTMPGCLRGTIEGSPAKAMDDVVQLLADGHARYVPKGAA